MLWCCLNQGEPYSCVHIKGDDLNTSDAAAVFIRSRHARRLAPNTITTYEWALSILKDKYPSALPSQAQDIEDLFLDHSDKAAETMVGLWRKLRTFWMWLAQEGIAENIMLKVPRPQSPKRLPQTLNTTEINSLLGATLTKRDYVLLTAFLDTGLRVGEMTSIKRSDIDAVQGSVRVDGKTGERFVPISIAIAESMLEMSDDSGVWVSNKGKMTRWGLQGIVRRCMRRAKLDSHKIGPHTLRHTFAHQYILNGGDVSSLQDILGHSKVETTMIYLSMSVSTLIEQHGKFSPIALMVERGEYDEGIVAAQERTPDMSVFIEAGKKSGRVRRARTAHIEAVGQV